MLNQELQGLRDVKVRIQERTNILVAKIKEVEAGLPDGISDEQLTVEITRLEKEVQGCRQEAESLLKKMLSYN